MGKGSSVFMGQEPVQAGSPADRSCGIDAQIWRAAPSVSTFCEVEDSCAARLSGEKHCKFVLALQWQAGRGTSASEALITAHLQRGCCAHVWSSAGCQQPPGCKC